MGGAVAGVAAVAGVSDLRSFDDVFAEQYVAVLRTASLLLGDPEAAADVTQEAFVQLHLHWRKVRDYDRPGAWVRRVAIRLASRELRRRNRRLAIDAGEDRLTEAEGSEAHGDLRSAVLLLPAGQRAAIVLHYLEDLPVREVASVMRCSEATARVHLHRGRKRLAELLAEEVS